MNSYLRAMFRGWVRPSEAVTLPTQNPGINEDGTADSARKVGDFAWCCVKTCLWIPARILIGALRLIWRFRRTELGLAIIACGLGIAYLGYFHVLTLKSPQEVYYNKAMDKFRFDRQYMLDHHLLDLTVFKRDTDLLEKSLLYFKEQSDAGLLDRLLYGRPDVRLAAQALNKIGIVKVDTAHGDNKVIQMGKELIEQSITLNAGAPFNTDLSTAVGPLLFGPDVATLDILAVEALAPQRNLEMLFRDKPNQRTQKPDKSQDKKDSKDQAKDQDKKDPKDQDKKDPKDQKKKQNGKSDDPKNKKEGDQKGVPDKPNDRPSDKKQDDKQNSKMEAPSNHNATLEQNMRDVKNGTANDGI